MTTPVTSSQTNRLQTMPPCVQMSTQEGPNTPVVTLFAALSCHNPSSPADSNPRWPPLPANKNCHIRLTGICSFCTYMLELTSAIFEVTVTENHSFL